MGSSVIVTAIKAPDDVWKKHKAVWDACEAADVEPPAETCEFFEDEDPDPDGVSVFLGSLCNEYRRNKAMVGRPCEYGTEVTVKLSDLPDGTTHLMVRWG